MFYYRYVTTINYCQLIGLQVGGICASAAQYQFDGRAIRLDGYLHELKTFLKRRCVLVDQ